MSQSNWLEVAYSTTDFDKLIAKFRSAETLPDLPASALQLCDAIDKGDANTSELERIILADPAITAQVLKSANSAQYGGQTSQASTARGAILLLGHKAIRSIAVAVWVHALVHQAKGSPKFSATRFAMHSMFVGFLSKYLLSSIQKTRGVKSAWSPDELFAAGVLHDLGLGLLASVDSRLYEKTFEAAAAYNITLNHAFFKLTGRSIDVLSVAAAQVWRLPAVFIDVLSGYSDPLNANAEVDALCCLHYADHLANQTGNSLWTWRVDKPIDPVIYERVGLAPDDIPAVLALVSNHTKDFVAAA